uniref:Mitotic spindle assembly checkpoint protein MAD1 n=2 Tax=Cacopsylla melanoneura TaxID=428564 RepID=A0A8D9FEQ8_9HEMI
MNNSDPEEPTCILKMLNEFNRNAPDVPSFPFVFERVSNVSHESSNNQAASTTAQSTGSVKKRKVVDVKNAASTLDESDRSLSDSFAENIPASPWESKTLRQDLIEARTKVKNLDYRYQELLSLKKSSDILYEKDRETFKYEEEKLTRKIREMERHLKQVRVRATKLEEELSDMKCTAPVAIAELEGEQHALEVQKSILNARVAELEEDLRRERSCHARLKAEWEAKVSSWDSEKQALESSLEKLRLELKEKNVTLQKQEMYKTKLMVAQQKVQELQLEVDNNRENVKQMDSMQQKLLNYADVLKENETLTKKVSNLRELISNNLLLEGQLEELKLQQKKAEENQSELIRLKAETMGLKQDLKQWTELARHYFRDKEVSSEHLLIVDMKDLVDRSQRNIIELTYEKKELQQELQKVKEKNTSLSLELETAHARDVKSKGLLEKYASSIRRLKKQNNLVTWERDDLRQMVDSFQKEVTLIGNTTFSDATSGGASGGEPDKCKIETLMSVIEGYTKRMKELEADKELVCVSSDQSSSSHPDVRRLTTERDELLKEKEELVKKEKELTDKVEHLNYQMEWRALKGDFDIRETKVLKLRHGPHDKESTSSTAGLGALDQLRMENEQLKEKIRILKEQGASGAVDVTIQAENNVSAAARQQVEELNAKIKSLQVQGKRLREVYKTSSQEFRETVYQLFGYKVDRTQNMYKLASMYADAPTDNLLFQSLEGELNLIETDYSKVLKPLLDLHLGQHHSIPMLMSALTQELFQRQTMRRYRAFFYPTERPKH